MYAFIHSFKPPWQIMNKSAMMPTQTIKPRTKNVAREDNLNALVGTTSEECPILSVEYFRKTTEHSRRRTPEMDDRNENGIIALMRYFRSLLSILYFEHLKCGRRVATHAKTL